MSPRYQVNSHVPNPNENIDKLRDGTQPSRVGAREMPKKMEDGLELLLNLNLPEDSAPRARAAKVKGGRWTDRAKIRKAGKRKDPPSDPQSSRPPKRQRQDAVQPAATRNETSHKSSATTTAAATTPRSGAVISSLFTSNPTIPEQPAPARPRRPVAPSNAPLTDASSFADLGLDQLLVSHLELKMNVRKPTAIQRAAIPKLLSEDPAIASRDAFIQSQTGSGKTFSFLLPIIQDLLPLSELSYINRSIGTLAIIIAPTRELAKQISDVLESLLLLRLRSYSDGPDADETSPRLTRWLVSGLLIGGSTKGHEKARLRKGLPILVSTPGRLLDHLQRTTSFDVGKCRWLVLDEADRLMDLGFEETLDGILKGLDGRRKLALQAVQDGTSTDVGDWDWGRSRRTILCSATIRDDLRNLAGRALKEPINISGADPIEEPIVPRNTQVHSSDDTRPEELAIPSQLAQKYLIVPLKLRLVSLVALLRSLLVAKDEQIKPVRVLVFLSTTDSVDFHWWLLGGVKMGNPTGSRQEDDESETSPSNNNSPQLLSISAESALLPGARIYKLHGSMLLQHRQASLKAFTENGKHTKQSSSILFCTSVASRGLDLPFVSAVVQYDLPTENGATEYVHRIGRTARAGKTGQSFSFVAPCESHWVDWLADKLSKKFEGPKASQLQPIKYDDVLKVGLGGNGSEHQRRATELQLAVERFVLQHAKDIKLAQQAFGSYVRAYATHPAEERHIFHVRQLHLGHLAKAFGLRDAPGIISSTTTNPSAPKNQPKKVKRVKSSNTNTVSEFQIMKSKNP